MLELQRVLDVVDGLECHGVAGKVALVEGGEGAPDWLAIGVSRLLHMCDATAVNVQPQHRLFEAVQERGGGHGRG